MFDFGSSISQVLFQAERQPNDNETSVSSVIEFEFLKSSVRVMTTNREYSTVSKPCFKFTAFSLLHVIFKQLVFPTNGKRPNAFEWYPYQLLIDNRYIALRDVYTGKILRYEARLKLSSFASVRFAGPGAWDTGGLQTDAG